MNEIGWSNLLLVATFARRDGLARPDTRVSSAYKSSVHRDSPSDEVQIRAVHTTWIEAVNAGNLGAPAYPGDRRRGLYDSRA